MTFKLRFDARKIADWSARYEYDDRVPIAIAPRALARGHLLKSEFLAIAKWKSQRTRSHCAKNSPGFIESVTATAFASRDARLQIEVLTLLTGVSWPTASVLLHFYAKGPYPVLDYRALWSLSHVLSQRDYTFSFWQRYTAFAVQLADQTGVSMRTLDRALWQYSKDNQPALG